MKNKLSTLYSFGDESGTMPLSDNAKPFVTATVAFLGKPPSPINGSDDDAKLVDILKQSNGIPFLAVVKPCLGYGNKLKIKYDKMELMGRAKRLLDGKYNDSISLNLRNMIWAHAMGQAVVHVVRSTLFNNNVACVRILLDEKTMTKPFRSLFTAALFRMHQNISEGMMSLEKSYPMEIQPYLNRIQFSSESTSIQWSDDSPNFRKEFGLKLADRLARKMYRQLESGSKAGIESLLKDAGFEDFLIDITELVIRPLNQKLINAWKRDTGLPEPRL